MSALDEIPLTIGLGPVRTGSTWLYEFLRGHSQVAVTCCKEVNFFNHSFENGWGWYKQQFESVNRTTRWRVDVSPTYFSEPIAIARMIETRQPAKFIVGLRSPYARMAAWHEAFMSKKMDLIEREASTQLNSTALRIGLISESLRKLMGSFGSDSVVMYDFEELQTSPVSVCESIQKALGLDYEEPPSVLRICRFERSLKPEHAWAGRLSRFMRREFPQAHYRMKHSRVLRCMQFRDETSNAPAEAVTRAFAFFRDEYEEEISALERLLKRDLIHWRYERQIEAMHAREKNHAEGPDAL